MESYKSLQYSYNSRTKRYTILVKNVDKILNGFRKIIGKSATGLMFVKVKKNQFDIYEFFLLEFEYILEVIRNEYPEVAVGIGGIILVDLQDFLNEKTWLADRQQPNVTNILDMKEINRVMKFPPMEHQLDVFEKYEINKRLGALRGMMLDLAPGLGKSYTSLAIGEALHYETFVIVAPGNTIDEVWVKSVTTELYKTPQPYFVYRANSTNYSKQRFMIMTYEALDKLANDKKNLRLLKRLKPILIVDEFHNFNNIESLRTGNLAKVVDKVDFQDIVLLTGTPIKMSYEELMPMLYILDRKFPPIADIFKFYYQGFNYKKLDMFRYRFDLYKKTKQKDTSKLPKLEIVEHRVKVPDGTKLYSMDVIKREFQKYKIDRVKEFLDNMDKYEADFERILMNVKMEAFRQGMLKKDIDVVLKDYKAEIKTIRKADKANNLFSVGPQITKAREIEDNFILKYLVGDEKKEFKHVRSIIKYPGFKAMGEALGRVIMGKRISCYKALASAVNYKELLGLTTKKGIVFSSYVGVCKNAIAKSGMDGYHPIGVFGEHIEHLPEYVKEFNDLKNKTNPIVATYKALSTGVPLIGGNIIIMLDIPVRLYLMDQAVSRAWRIGQDKPVTIILVKLDTGKIFNITDRDNFILNLSTENVEMLTGNKIPYEIPKQVLMSDVEEELELEDEKEAQDKIEADLEEELVEDATQVISKMVDFSDLATIRNLVKRLKIKLK